MDEIVEDLKEPVIDNYTCKECARYGRFCPECYTYISGMTSDGKVISTPSNFIRKEN